MYIHMYIYIYIYTYIHTHVWRDPELPDLHASLDRAELRELQLDLAAEELAVGRGGLAALRPRSGAE